MKKLDRQECAARFGISPRQWDTWEKLGLLPAPEVTADGHRWLESDLAAWEAAGFQLCQEYERTRAANDKLNKGAEWTSTFRSGPKA